MVDRHFFDLLFFKTLSNIRAEASQTFIGYFWWVFEPAMFIGIYYLVFAVIIKSKTPDFITFLIVGIITFQWFSGAITMATPSLQNNAGLIQQLRVNKLIFPLSSILHEAWKFLFVFFVYGIIVLFFMDVEPSWHWVAIPYVMLAQLFCIAGISLPIAAIYPYFPDVKHIIQPILRALLFVSGIFFPADKVPEDMRTWFYMNPMASIIENYRMVILRHEWPDWTAMGIVMGVSVLLFIGGHLLLRRFNLEYAKVLA